MGTRSRFRTGKALADYKARRQRVSTDQELDEADVQRRAERRDKNRGYTLDIIDITQPHPPHGKHVFIMGRTYISRVWL